MKKISKFQVFMLTAQIVAVLQLVLYLFLVMGFEATFDTATPDGTVDPPAIIDDRIREVKSAVQERQNVDHYWPLTGTQVSDADAGKHRQVTFQAALASDAGNRSLYPKTVSGIAELFYRDSAGTVKQLTTNGKLNVVSTEAVLPTGDQAIGGTKTFTASAVFNGGLTVGQDVDVGNYDWRAKSFTSDVATGTPPLAVASTTGVTNLNADMVDGYHVGAIVGPATVTDSLGNPLAKDFVYRAECDGYITGMTGSLGTRYIYSDASNPPTTAVSGAPEGTTVHYVIRKNDYVKVTAVNTVRWLPFGTGNLVKQ